jgi:hypothetical protein
MTQYDRSPFHLQRELAAKRRRRRGNALMVGGFTVVIVGLLLLTTDWFGTGILSMLAGFVAANYGSEIAS